MLGDLSIQGSLRGSDGKVCLQSGRVGFHPWVGRIPWRREWQPTPVFLPGGFHRQRSLAGCSPCGRKELDMTEQLISLIFFFSILNIVVLSCSLINLSGSFNTLYSAPPPPHCPPAINYSIHPGELFFQFPWAFCNGRI